MFLVRLSQIVIIVLLMQTLAWGLPKLDGYLFPVSRNLDLFVQTDPDEPDSVLVSGVYER